MARDAGGFDEGGDGVRKIGESADEMLGFEVGGEFGPALEAVLAGENELGVDESEAGGSDSLEGEFVEGGMEAPDAVNRVGVGCLM